MMRQRHFCYRYARKEYIEQSTLDWFHSGRWRMGIMGEFEEYIEKVSNRVLILRSDHDIIIPYSLRHSKEYKKKISDKFDYINFTSGHSITFTTDPKKFFSIVSATENLKRTQNQLITNLKRKYGKFSYLSVLEFGDHQIPHVHILTNIKQKLDLKFIRREVLRQCTQINVQKIRNTNAVSYVLKYLKKMNNHLLTQACFWITNSRLYTNSRGLIATQKQKKNQGFVYIGSFSFDRVKNIYIDSGAEEEEPLRWQNIKSGLPIISKNTIISNELIQDMGAKS